MTDAMHRSFFALLRVRRYKNADKFMPGKARKYKLFTGYSLLRIGL